MRKVLNGQTNRVLGGYLLLFLCSPMVVMAQINSEAINIGTIEVTEQKEISGRCYKEATVDSQAIETEQLASTADSLFDDIAGLDLKRSSLAGNAGSTVWLRGFDESRYLVLKDGRPLNGSGVYGGEVVDWSSISLEDIEQVEIVRGAKSAEYGNTLGGAINIITKKGQEKMMTKLQTSYGSFNTMDAAVSHNSNIGHFLYDSLSYGYWKSDGYLRNNTLYRNTFSARVDLVLPYDMTLGVGARYTIQERGFVVENKKENSNYNSDYPESDEEIGAGPTIQWRGKAGPFGPIDPTKYWGDGSYWTNQRGQYDLELGKTFGALDLKAQGYINTQKRTEYYCAIDDSSKLVLERYSEPENSGGWLVKASMPLNKHKLVAGLEGIYLGYGGQKINYADSSYFRIIPYSSDGLENVLQRHSVFSQNTLVVTDDLNVNIGLRYDSYRAEEAENVRKQGISPKLGLDYKLAPGVTVQADFGQAYRFPTSPESYWYFAGYQPDVRRALSPERAIQAEVAIISDISDKAKVSMKGYYYHVNDYIRTIFGYRPSRVVYNIDKVMLWGAEIEGQYALLKELHVFTNYTYQNSKKEGDILDLSSEVTDRLVELPENKVNVGLRCWFFGVASECVFRYVDARSVVTGDLTQSGATVLEDLQGFITFGVNFSYEVLKKESLSGTLRLAVENLFDVDYEETAGFPMPGRTITGGVILTF